MSIEMSAAAAVSKSKNAREVDSLLWQLHCDAAEAVFYLGGLAQATQLLLTAAELAQGFGQGDRRLAETLNKLGVLSYYERKHTAAKALVERSLVLQARTGEEGVDRARLLYNLAGIYDACGDHVNAEATSKRACEVLEASASQDADLALCLLQLGEIYLATDRPVLAIFALRRALSIMEARRVEDWITAAILTRIGDYYVIQKRPHEADPNYWRALEIRKTLFGEEPPIVKTLDRIVCVYCGQRKFSEAQVLQEWAVSILKKALGPQNPRVLARVMQLAGTMRGQAKLEEVRELFQLSLPVFEETLGDDDPRLGQIFEHYAEVLRILRDNEGAVEYEGRARRIQSTHRFLPPLPEDGQIGTRIDGLVSWAAGGTTPVK
jgi:tetratricopeptide (TPR) repeat protein